MREYTLRWRKTKMKKALAETMPMAASAKKRADKLNNAKKCAHCDKDIKKKVWIEGLNAVVCLPCGGSIRLDSNGHHASCWRCAQSYIPNLGSVEDLKKAITRNAGLKM